MSNKREQLHIVPKNTPLSLYAVIHDLKREFMGGIMTALTLDPVAFIATSLGTDREHVEVLEGPAKEMLEWAEQALYSLLGALAIGKSYLDTSDPFEEHMGEFDPSELELYGKFSFKRQDVWAQAKRIHLSREGGYTRDAVAIGWEGTDRPTAFVSSTYKMVKSVAGVKERHVDIAHGGPEGMLEDLGFMAFTNGHFETPRQLILPSYAQSGNALSEWVGDAARQYAEVAEDIREMAERLARMEYTALQ